MYVCVCVCVWKKHFNLHLFDQKYSSSDFFNNLKYFFLNVFKNIIYSCNIQSWVFSIIFQYAVSQSFRNDINVLVKIVQQRNMFKKR